MSDSRRDFFKKSALLGLSGLAGTVLSNSAINNLNSVSELESNETKYTLPTLAYSYNALEPFIDAQTMELHHSKHHRGYVDKLNKALENYKGDTTLPVLFSQISKLDVSIRNNGGGHYNHSLFWNILQPNASGAKLIPDGKIAEAIKTDFKSFEEFQIEFAKKSSSVFGSGWCWLIKQNGKLKITTTSNQDNPLMDLAEEKGTPILALDVWEHAYYLKYQNKRVDYVSNWWNIINWAKVNELFITN